MGNDGNLLVRGHKPGNGAEQEYYFFIEDE